MNRSLKNMTALWPALNGPVVNYISRPPSQDYANRWPRKLCVLGSTGSIGVNALKTLKPNVFCPHSLAGARNTRLLAEQALKFRPAKLAVLDESHAKELARLLPRNYRPEIYYGSRGYEELAKDDAVDCVLSAQTGGAGLNGTLAAALAGKIIALANKESLVLAGGMLRRICQQTGASILPVDSEHYAFFQCVAGQGERPAHFLLTASGGPFRNMPKEDLPNVTPEMALAHPTWSMGRKITIDSATLMNKGFEFIETLHLFGLKPRNITVLAHPQSVAHGLVVMRDNSLLAQLATPDMKLPIAACLYWPRLLERPVKPLDLIACGPLVFEKPHEEKFICLRLARDACLYKADETWSGAGLNPACIVLAAANDAAVELFLENKAGFCDIGKFVEAALQNLVYDKTGPMDLENTKLTDPWQWLARIRALESSVREFVHSLAASSSKRLPDRV